MSWKRTVIRLAPSAQRGFGYIVYDDEFQDFLIRSQIRIDELDQSEVNYLGQQDRIQNANAVCAGCV